MDSVPVPETTVEPELALVAANPDDSDSAAPEPVVEGEELGIFGDELMPAEVAAMGIVH